MTTAPHLEPATLTDSEMTALRSELRELQENKREQLAAVDLVGLTDDQVARAQAQVARDTLTQVEAALERLDAGTYGRCVHCAGVIPLGRLEIVPHTDSCVGCRGQSPR